MLLINPIISGLHTMSTVLFIAITNTYRPVGLTTLLGSFTVLFNHLFGYTVILKLII